MTRSALIIAAALLSVPLVAAADALSGADVSMMLLYAIPILAVSRWCGTRWGVALALLCAVTSLAVHLAILNTPLSSAVISWNAVTRLGIFLLLAYTVSLQASLRKALEQERLLSRTDQLTGLLNKWAFQEQVEHEMAQSKRYHHPLTIAFVDLDNFKEVNDLHGHARGDRLLQDVARALRRAVRKTDSVGRVGGDEFAIFFPETGPEEARTAIAKVRESLDVMTSQSGWQVTASIGVVTCTEVFESYDALLGTADRLMYLAKDRGKNAVEFLITPSPEQRSTDAAPP